MAKKYNVRTVNDIEPNDRGNIELNVDVPVTEEFLVTKAAGNFNLGDTFPGGKTIAEAFRLLLTGYYSPTTSPISYSLSNNAGIRESGDVFDMVLTSTFNRGSILGKLVNNVWNPSVVQNSLSGLPSQHIINGTTYTTTNLTQTRTINGQVVLLGTNGPFTGSVTYSQGPQATDSNNQPFGTPLPSGVTSSSTSFIGYLRRFSGVLPTMPTTGEQIRTMLLSSSVINSGDSFSITTGNVNRNFVIAVPNGKVLLTAKEVITGENIPFILSTTITTVPDLGGVNRPYKVYTCSIADPYPVSTTINITLTNG